MMKSIKKYWSIILTWISRFFIIIAKNWIWLLILMFIFLLSLYQYNCNTEFKSYFDKKINSPISIATFIVAIILGYQNWRREWEEKLPKKLTVHFKYDNQYVYTCYNAEIPEKTDIRAWAQQIGNQMNGGYLEFYPFINSDPSIIIDNEYKYYKLTFYLIKNKKNENRYINGKQGYKFWWDNNIKNKDKKNNKQIIYQGIIKKPFDTYIETLKNVEIESITSNDKIKFLNAVNKDINIQSEKLAENKLRIGTIDLEVKNRKTELLINLSNHTFEKWQEKQKEEAQKSYGTIVDMEFPYIETKANHQYIQNLARIYKHKLEICSLEQNHQNFAVHIMGEQTFCYALITLLKKENIKVIASTTERNVVDLGDGKKETTFEFVQFREY